jgi:type II secretory pathway pseudopilin PulG
MLVVITIIGILASLAITGVQSTREKARIAQCQNNLSGLAKAGQQFALRKNYFPRWRVDIGTTNNVGNTTGATAGMHSYRTSWVAQLMADLEHGDYDTAFNNYLTSSSSPNTPADWMVTNAGTKMVWSAMICPTDQQPGYAQLNYGINAGIPDNYVDPSTGKAPTDILANSVAFDPMTTAPTGINPSEPQLSLSQIKDGESKTILFAEKRFLPAPNSPAEWTHTFTSSYSPRDRIEESAQTVMWIKPPAPAPPAVGAEVNPISQLFTPSGPTTLGYDNSNFLVAATPSSAHRAGFLVAFCGGNVQLVSADITYQVYAQLMTPDGNKVRFQSATAPVPIWQAAPLSEADIK